jgi:formylglycine-generating enzyme required for sulfatase activity/predicted Ser/Thr protein kinase
MVCPNCKKIVQETDSFCSFCNSPLQQSEAIVEGAYTDVSETELKVIGNRYSIIEEIARGGMGIVYKAHDQQLDMMVAIKVLSPSLAGDRQGLENLKREAKTAMLLSHPNIMRLHNFEEIGDTRFLTMEFIDGETLAKLLAEEKRFSISDTIKFAIQVCAGLDYAHQKKVVHRDIKPSNLMLDRDGVVKITDFGIAGVVQDTISRVTQTTVTGTLAYMAPERLKGEKTDHRSDIYSLGVVLYEFLTGHPPFYTGGIEYQIIHAEPKPIPGIPDHLQEIIAKSLTKNPEERWESARELYNALNRRRGATFGITDEEDHSAEAQAQAVARPILERPAKQLLTYGIISVAAFLVVVSLIYLLISKKVMPPEKAEVKPVKVMSADVQKKVAQLIADGDKYIEQEAYTKPFYANAFKTFSDVLKLDPDNYYARKKISWIKEKYISWGNQALGKKTEGEKKLDSLLEAKDFFLQALLIEPEDEYLTGKIRELDEQVSQLKTKLALFSEKTEVKKASKPSPSKVDPYKDMVRVAAGDFLMGTTKKDIDTIVKFFPDITKTANWMQMFDDEICSKGELRIFLDEFWIDRHEVTNKEYQEFILANPQWSKSKIRNDYHDGNYLKYWNGDDYPVGKENHPVVHVSWYAAKAYAEWRKKRLPTEAEWEKAARGQNGQVWSWGNIWNKTYLNSNEAGIMDTVPVESFPQGKSPYGVYDMLGNVWEWCHDWYSKNYYNLSHSRNPKGPPGGSVRVIRGGSYNSFPSRLYLTNRRYIEPITASYSIGFRCVKDAKPEG